MGIDKAFSVLNIFILMCPGTSRRSVEEGGFVNYKKVWAEDYDLWIMSLLELPIKIISEN